MREISTKPAFGCSTAGYSHAITAMTAKIACILLLTFSPACQKKMRGPVMQVAPQYAFADWVADCTRDSTQSADGWWTPAQHSKPRVKLAGEICYEDYDWDGIPDIKHEFGGRSRIHFSDNWTTIRVQKSDPRRGCKDFGGRRYVFDDGAWRKLDAKP